METSSIVFWLAFGAVVVHLYATHVLIEYLKSKHRSVWERLEKPRALFGNFASSLKFFEFVTYGHAELKDERLTRYLFFTRISVILAVLLTIIFVFMSVAFE